MPHAQDRLPEPVSSKERGFLPLVHAPSDPLITVPLVSTAVKLQQIGELLRRVLPLPVRSASHLVRCLAILASAVISLHGDRQGVRFRQAQHTGTSPLAPCEEPNDTWCVDFKGHLPWASGYGATP